MSILLTRRSVRVFTEEPVEQTHIDHMIQAAIQAPSAKNQQPWRFIVVKNRDLLDRLSGISHGARHLKNAPLAIVTLMQEHDTPMPHMRPSDCAAATQNILLAAHEQGLGAVWIGVFPLSMRAENVREILEIPSEFTPFSIVAVGHPKHIAPAKPRTYDGRVEVKD